MEVTKTEAKEVLDAVLINELGTDLTMVEIDDLSEKILARFQEDFELFEEDPEDGDEDFDEDELFLDSDED